jgi:hypothetical protein
MDVFTNEDEKKDQFFLDHLEKELVDHPSLYLLSTLMIVISSTMRRMTWHLLIIMRTHHTKG